jgi:hypothetical protein
LAPQPSLGLVPLQKIRLNFLQASQQFSFSQGRVVIPTPNPHPGGPGLCIYIPQRQDDPVITLGTHFSRLLRHAWVTVGKFLFPAHHTGKSYIFVGFISYLLLCTDNMIYIYQPFSMHLQSFAPYHSVGFPCRTATIENI